MKVQFEGLRGLILRTDGKLLARPLRNFLTRAAIVVQGTSRKEAPVDTGLLRSDIDYEVEAGDLPLWAKVGTNTFYGPFQEFGTRQGQPPAGALERWAGRHAFARGGDVAVAIGRAGGVKPKRFMGKGMDELMRQARGLVEKLGQEIKAKWDERSG